MSASRQVEGSRLALWLPMLRSSTPWLAVLASVAVIFMIGLARSEVDFTYQDPDIRLVVIAVLASAILLRSSPVVLWLWWSWGALTLAWSLAPGSTHVTSLWEVTYLAAFAAARWRPAVWLAVAWVVANGAFDLLALESTGLRHYVSGSAHYVAGALSLVLIPVALYEGLAAKKWTIGLLWAGCASLAIFVALASGARAVYLPLAAILVTIAVRYVLWQGRRWRVATLVAGTVVTGVALMDMALPSSPVTSALGVKASAQAQVEGTETYGVFAQRLRFWDQTLEIAWKNPLGAGVGSYQAIVHAYQKYPMLWSNSPHNYFVETLATGGWPRLILLLVVLALSTWRTWRSDAWAWSLSALGIWTTFAFDVTSYYPSVMMFAFMALGASYYRGHEAGSVPPNSATKNWSHKLAVLVIGQVACIALAAWWFLPCSGPQCFLTRYHGAPYLAVRHVEASPDAQRGEVLARLRSLYPQSLWVLQLEQRYADGPASRLGIAVEIAERFPLQSPQNYLEWADAALALGDTDQAREAVLKGLEVFGPSDYPFGEHRLTHAMYEDWLAAAQAILDTTSQLQ